jgi:hypothetical protein
MSLTQAFLLDCFLQTEKLLTIAFSSDGLVPLKQFIMDNPLHIPPDAQHCLVRMKIRLHTGCCLLVLAQPVLPFLEIDIEAPFFITSDNAGQKRLMLLMSKTMTSEQRSTDGDTLILVVLSQNVWHPYYQLLDLTHRLQMSDDCCIVRTHITGQFSSCLTGIHVD